MAATSPYQLSVHETRVVKVLPRGRVIIDARELRRVIDRKTGEVLVELLEQCYAETYAETVNEIANNDHAIVVPYQAPKSRKRPAAR
jgi:hypothetical protein